MRSSSLILALSAACLGAAPRVSAQPPERPLSGAPTYKGLPFEAYRVTLSVSTPPGRLRRSTLLDTLANTPQTVVAWMTTRPEAPPTPSIECVGSMPIIAPDTTRLAPMPVIVPKSAHEGEAASPAVLRGCGR